MLHCGFETDFRGREDAPEPNLSRHPGCRVSLGDPQVECVAGERCPVEAKVDEVEEVGERGVEAGQGQPSPGRGCSANGSDQAPPALIRIAVSPVMVLAGARRSSPSATQSKLLLALPSKSLAVSCRSVTPFALPGVPSSAAGALFCVLVC